jgi:acyl-coenzyme A synthetase/AMP-(fatty) acid ligase
LSHNGSLAHDAHVAIPHRGTWAGGEGLSVDAFEATAGEVPKAFVVLKGEATPDQIKAFAAECVAPYKKVRRVEFVNAIPKTASGKIPRRVLVDRERAAMTGNTA